MGTATDFKILAATIVFLAAFNPLASGQSLPKAETILDRYVEVTGGKARYEKLKTQVSSGIVELSNPGMTGSFTIFRASPNRLYTIMELPVGTVEEGVDGQVGWSKSPMMQPRIKQGQEGAAALTAAFFNGDLRWRDRFAGAELVGEEKV